MGYYADQVDVDFYLDKSNFPKVIAAIRALAGNGRYSWVKDSYLDSDNIVDIFRCWRWGVSLDDNGNIVDISFAGEKLGDDEVLFQAIAPYVKNNSYIEMHGEDHAMWRWVFVDGKLTEKYARIVWE